MASFFDIMKLPPVPYPGDEKYRLFKRISIEPISFCNRKCVFCPVAWNDRGKTHMSDTLYEKIVAELGQHKFDGVAQLFLLSEPMIDHTLTHKAEQLRYACPDASLYISSNGDVLDKIAQAKGMNEAIAKLKTYYDAGINVININAYDPGPDQLNRYYAIWTAAQEQLGVEHTGNKYRHHSPRRRFLCITDMRFNEREEIKGTDIFYLRNKQDRDNLKASGEKVQQRHCSRTQNHIVVLFDGAVPICCAIDPNDRTMMAGDANTQSLEEIWNSEVFFKYRYYTQQAKRVLPGCDTCTHKMAFPHVVHKVQPDEATAARWEAELDKTPREVSGTVIP